ncbi:MAG: hypothetical protein LUC91_03305 [Prevotella sp.]|nr:hypothetical protein [Prevotella sp.]
MRKFLVLFGLLFALTVNAQQMPSIAGVTFGWSYSSCKRVLDNRFNNGESSYQSYSDELSYYNVSFGGYRFNYVNFDFQSDGSRTYLYYISFVCSFEVSDSKSATSFRDSLYETYKQKYEFRWSGEDDGYKYYVLGHDPHDPDNGFIIISTMKSTNGKGEMKLFTSVSYTTSFIDPVDEI